MQTLGQLVFYPGHRQNVVVCFCDSFCLLLVVRELFWSQMCGEKVDGVSIVATY
jgi:hypothetical protein